MGKILTDSKRLNIAIILLIIVDLILIFIGILYAIMGFMPYHEKIIGKSLSKVNSDVMKFIYTVIRINGFMFITLGVTGIYILFVGFRKKEKWAWIYTLLVVALANFPTTIIIFVMNPTFEMPFPLTLSLLIMGIIALCISYKEFE